MSKANQVVTNETKYADRVIMEEALNKHPGLSYRIDNLFKADPTSTTLFLKAKFLQLEKLRYGKKESK